MMPVELQVANVSNIITFVVGIVFLYYALKEFGNPVSARYFKLMALGILLYGIFHEGMDIIAGTPIQYYAPAWIFGTWPVLILQNIGPVIFVIGAYLYHKEMFKTIGGG
jgi:hypothetical protein